MPSSISTVRLVGVPRGDGAVVDHGDASGRDLLAHQAGKGGRLLAVEIAFQPVADGLVQHDARPAGAEHDVHFACRCGDRFKIDQRLAQRLVDRGLPAVGSDETLIALAAADAGAAALLPVAIAGHDRHVQPHQRPDVTISFAVGAQDFNHLPGGGDAGGYLPHARILGARIGVHGFQQFHFRLEWLGRERIVVAIELAVGAAGRVGIGAGVAAFHRAHGFGGARQRAFRQVGGVRIADRFAFDGAQAEALRRVVGRLLESAVVEGQHLRLLVFQEQFAVVGAFQATSDQLPNLALVEPGAIDQRGNAFVHKGAPCSPRHRP
jgi:hypothetical protein